MIRTESAHIFQISDFGVGDQGRIDPPFGPCLLFWESLTHTDCPFGEPLVDFSQNVFSNINEDGYLSFGLRGGSKKIRWILSNVHQLDRSETFRVLVRFQNSWYLFCLARSETFENGNYNSEIDDLPTLSGVTVKRFSGKSIISIVTQNRQPPQLW